MQLIFFNFTFPNSNRVPSSQFQSFCNKLVSRRISQYFICPIISMLFWFRVATIMTVPKTTISKNCNTLFGKHKVWIPQ